MNASTAPQEKLEPEDKATGDESIQKEVIVAATAAGKTEVISTKMDESETYQTPFGGSAQNGISDLPESCRGNSDRVGRFEEEERHVRDRAKHSIAWLAAVNGYSALLVFIFHLISLESMLSIALSVGLTLYTYYQTVRMLLFKFVGLHAVSFLTFHSYLMCSE